jgi:tRNA A-37 threonylcarbamoyl transferase component Bud32
MAIVQAVGRPVNESERKAIDYFARHLPGERYIIFHNLELPGPSGQAFEYDLIIIGEYAVYCIEVKGYHGLIKGNAYEWEMEWGEINTSPIPLANKKARILKSWLARLSASLRDVWVESLIVLTDEQAQVNLRDPQANRVMHLNEAVTSILHPPSLPTHPESIAPFSKLIYDGFSRYFRPLHRQQQIGDYRVIQTIGKNNLYTTLLAEHVAIRKKRFTLKIYNLSFYENTQTRAKQVELMVRDANALQQLAGHANIVRASTPFWDENRLVLPLEWVEGYSLRGLLEAGTPLAFARQVDIVRQVCIGLRYAHSQRIIHRDVRPENIIIPTAGPVKLVNFDCARIEDADVPTIASRVGRQLDERYIAPELWADPSYASVSSDLYAAGIVFFEILTGQTPYQHMKEVFAAKGLPRLPTQVKATLSRDADEVIGRMCAFKIKDRYSTLEEVIEDLAIIG